MDRKDAMRAQLAELHALDPDLFAELTREVQKPPEKPGGRPKRPGRTDAMFWGIMRAAMDYHEGKATVASKRLWKAGGLGEAGAYRNGKWVKLGGNRAPATLVDDWQDADKRYKNDERYRDDAEFWREVWYLKFTSDLNILQAFNRVAGFT